MEYEAARAELYEEIAKGSSLEDIRTRLTKKDGTNSKQDTDVSKGNRQTKVQKPVEKKTYSTQRIQRKKRDLMQLLNKHIPVSLKPVEEKTPMKPKTFSAVELYSKGIEEQSDIDILNKKTFKIAGEELLVRIYYFICVQESRDGKMG